jgi:hypothetical protein
MFTTYREDYTEWNDAGVIRYRFFAPGIARSDFGVKLCYAFRAVEKAKHGPTGTLSKKSRRCGWRWYTVLKQIDTTTAHAVQHRGVGWRQRLLEYAGRLQT